MKSFFLALAFLIAAGAAGAQTVSSISTSVTITGTGFASGDTVTAQPSGTACSAVAIVNANSITANCPNGTTSVAVKAAGPAASYSWTPLAFSFSWAVGAAAPTAQSFQEVWLNCNGCPAAIKSGASWLTVGGESWGGTGGLTITWPVSINTSGLAAGTYTTTISGSTNGGTPATFSVPVTLTVTGAAATHAVTLKWNASAAPAGAPVTGYMPLKQVSNPGPFVPLVTTPLAPIALTFVDPAAAAGTPCYTVYAVNANGPSPNATPVCPTVP